MDIALLLVGGLVLLIAGIGGVTALIAPTAVPPEIVRFDNLVMVGVSLLVVAVAATGLRIGRREGALLVATCAVYLVAIWRM
jgi:cation:H+ antiporter